MLQHYVLSFDTSSGRETREPKYSEFQGPLTTVIERFRCAISETVWPRDFCKPCNKTTSFHSVAQPAVSKLVVQCDAKSIGLPQCLTKHIVIKNFIFQL